MGGGSANESICGRSTGPILMPFSENVDQGVTCICCKFGEIWLGGRHLKLVLKCEKSPTAIMDVLQVDGGGCH